MKYLFVGAALFLATGAAHAGRYNDWKCGDVSLQTSYEKHYSEDGTRVTHLTYGVHIDGLTDKQANAVNVRWLKSGQVYLIEIRRPKP
jgi:hypothetical protein